MQQSWRLFAVSWAALLVHASLLLHSPLICHAPAWLEFLLQVKQNRSQDRRTRPRQPVRQVSYTQSQLYALQHPRRTPPGSASSSSGGDTSSTAESGHRQPDAPAAAAPAAPSGPQPATAAAVAPAKAAAPPPTDAPFRQLQRRSAEAQRQAAKGADLAKELSPAAHKEVRTCTSTASTAGFMPPHALGALALLLVVQQRSQSCSVP